MDAWRMEDGGGRWRMEGGWNEGNEGEDEEGGSEGERRGTRGTKARRRPCSVFCSFLDSPLSTLDLEMHRASCIRPYYKRTGCCSRCRYPRIATSRKLATRK